MNGYLRIYFILFGLSMNVLMTTADHLMIDRRILQEAKTLIEHGHSVTLLAGFECEKRESYTQDGINIERFKYDWSDSRFLQLVKRIGLRPGTLIHKFAWLVFRSWAFRFSKLNSFEQYIVDRMFDFPADVIHIHDYPMLAAGVVAASKSNLPLVYDAHELYYAQTQLPVKTQRKYKRREARLIKKAHAVITVNPYIAKLMQSRYKIPLPHVLMNAAYKKPFFPGDLIRKKFDIPECTKIVIYQGWISSNRGIDVLVSAAKYFKEGVVLVVVGYGEYESQLRKIVAENDLVDRVYFYGGVPSDSLHEVTCGADLGVIPYHGVDENNFFCSPNKLFEFAVAKLPFICNDLPFLKDIINQYKNGIIADLSNPTAIAAVVNRFFQEDEAMSEISAFAAKAGDDLNWDIEGKKLMSIYSNLPFNHRES